MILVAERFFVAKEQWAAFKAQCRTLAGIMAGSPGCYHQCLVRGSVEFPSHIRYSAWDDGGGRSARKVCRDALK